MKRVRRNFVAFTLILAVLLGVVSLPAAAADAFTVSAELNYTNTPVTLDIEGTTPAKYGQIITAVVYKLAVADIAAVQEADGTFSTDPAAKKPLADVADIVRIGEVCASYDGAYELSLSLSNVADASYYIVAVSGGGKASAGAAASQLIYYEKPETIELVTLPAFNSATAQNLGTLLEQKQLLLGFTCDTDYRANSEAIHSLFLTVRSEDYQNTFATITDVQNALKSVAALRTLRNKPTAAQVEAVINANSALLSGYDFTDTDYTANKAAVYTMLSTFLAQSELLPDSMSDVELLLRQAAALVVLNQLDATEITKKDPIGKYYSYLGITLSDYTSACTTYGADSVNMAFVERSFTNPKSVNQALADRVSVLANPPVTMPYIPSGGTGSSNNVKITNDLVQPAASSAPAAITNYTDLSSAHWAYVPIQALSAKKIINGFEDGSIAPEQTVTWEQMIKMLATGFSLNGETSVEALGVSPDRWSAPYISAAAEGGLLSGFETGFAPGSEISRQDAAVLISRICKLRSVALSGEAKQPNDAAQIADYAKDDVSALMSAGILNGFEDGSFRPGETLTRAQAAKLIYSLLNR